MPDRRYVLPYYTIDELCIHVNEEWLAYVLKVIYGALSDPRLAQHSRDQQRQIVLQSAIAAYKMRVSSGCMAPDLSGTSKVVLFSGLVFFAI